MNKLNKLIEYYGNINSEELFHLNVTGRGSGNLEKANSYLNKYNLRDDEYFFKWKNIEDTIFDICSLSFFKSDFSVSDYVGGVLFDEYEFNDLRKNLRTMGDKYLIISQIEDDLDIYKPRFLMKYPSDITWRELQDGDFISVALFEMPKNKYLVYSEGALWGKYSDNDSFSPIDKLGFKAEIKYLFE